MLVRLPDELLGILAEPILSDHADNGELEMSWRSCRATVRGVNKRTDAIKALQPPGEKQ